MNGTIKAFSAAAIVALPVMAHAGSVTYEFTGTVTSATGIYSSAGSTVSGTIIIDFGAANPAQSSGTIGSVAAGQWYQQAYGGSYYNLPTPAGMVFSSTIKTGGVSYSDSTYANFGGGSSVTGHVYPSGAAGDAEWFANNTQLLSSTSFIQDAFDIGAVGTLIPFDANGLPIYGNANNSRTGSLVDISNSTNGTVAGQLNYTVNSLTAVPLPASVWLMLSGCVGLGVVVRHRKA
jgi:hypothetical protein